MRKIIYVFLLFVVTFQSAQAQGANQWSVELARAFSKDLFELNGIPYMNPMVNAVNATSNSRFFNNAYVPKEVEEPYFKISLNGMIGFVRDDMKTYTPQVPMQAFDIARVGDFANVDLINQRINIHDTAGLVNYFFQNILFNGVNSGRLAVPTTAATILGNIKGAIVLPNSTLEELVKEHPLWNLPYLPENLRDSILNAVKGIPGYFSLPTGGNINTIVAGIPQVEIGSLWGTEMLLRFIPPVYMGEEIGDFAFWGIGFKHSLSQYLKNEPFHLAIQAVYQGTHLENSVGVTNSELVSDATIWNVNLHASKDFEGIASVYTGISLENTQIDADFKYFLPVETQLFLGLLEGEKDDQGNVIRILPPNPPDFPGDTKPQSSNVSIEQFNIKWVIGARRDLGPFSIYLDFNLSKFNIFTGGLQYRIN